MPQDWVHVNDFDAPDRPRAIERRLAAAAGLGDLIEPARCPVVLNGRLGAGAEALA